MTTEYRLDVPPNLVVAQDPAPHARVLRGTAVDLVFSTGAEPLPLVQVPDFRGQPLELAVQRVEELGLVVGETFGEEDPNFQPGQVTDQFPEPGAEVEVGSVVNFVYRPAAATQIGFVPSAGGQTATDETASDGDVIVQSLITIHVPPGPEQEVEIVIIDNISARRVYYGVHRGDARVTHMLKGRGAGRDVPSVYRRRTAGPGTHRGSPLSVGGFDTGSTRRTRGVCMDVRDIVTRISGSYHPDLGLVTQAIGGASTVHTPERRRAALPCEGAFAQIGCPHFAGRRSPFHSTLGTGRASSKRSCLGGRRSYGRTSPTWTRWYSWLLWLSRPRVSTYSTGCSF